MEEHGVGYKSDIQKVTRTTESVAFPEVILIDNFNGCNLTCSMCDHRNIRKYRPIRKMDFVLYRKIIDEIAPVNPRARVWEIFFGDPFLLRDMPERIRYAKDRGLENVLLNTNGVLMSPDKAKAVIEAGLDAMYVGIDAVNEETYNKIRIGGDYRRAVDNVLRYQELLKSCGRDGQQLFVQFVVSDINEDQTGEFRDFWTSKGIKVKIRPKVSWAGLVEAHNLRRNEEIERKPCYWLMRTINICADGEVCLCSVDVHCKVKCGSVQHKTIKELWNGKLGEYRAMHREGRFDELPGMCRNCADWQSTYAEYYQ